MRRIVKHGSLVRGNIITNDLTVRILVVIRDFSPLIQALTFTFSKKCKYMYQINLGNVEISYWSKSNQLNYFTDLIAPPPKQKKEKRKLHKFSIT